MRIPRGLVPFGLTLLALAYSVGLLVWVVAVPAVDGDTLLDYGGPGSVAITAQPLLITLLMWALLRRRCIAGSRVATTTAWTIATLFLVWSVLGALSLAAGALPAALILVFAVALTPRPESRAAVAS